MIETIVVVSDELVGTGGFFAIRRFSLRNRRTDGSLSAPYNNDAVVRPIGQDAVVVAIFTRTAGAIRVLVRDGLRPTVHLTRDPAVAPLPEPAPGMFVTELVAGILEVGDSLAHRAAEEIREEAGFVVDPSRVVVLGAGMLGSPGPLAEKEYFCAVEVDPATQLAELPTDGSPMEEGATTRWLDLDDAIARCVRGDICDMKTEIGLRRLRDHLA
ncbi:MAG TPA: NUDIX domain-containing protein [Kofleriaceae bacterium]